MRITLETLAVESHLLENSLTFANLLAVRESRISKILTVTSLRINYNSLSLIIIFIIQREVFIHSHRTVKETKSILKIDSQTISTNNEEEPSIKHLNVHPLIQISIFKLFPAILAHLKE